MWDRTKRLINSYMEDLITRMSSSDKEVREITRAEIARLNEVEVQARAARKLLEKELAEIELKMVGLAERERLLTERGEHLAAQAAATDLVALNARRDLAAQQIEETKASAARARALRETRRQQGEELAAETHLTSMRENLSGAISPFSNDDPSSTIEEMRARINRSSPLSADTQLAEADFELEKQRARAQADELLARYKQSALATEREAPRPPSAVQQDQHAGPEAPAAVREEDQERDQQKTLGKSEGPIRPID